MGLLSRFRLHALRRKSVLLLILTGTVIVVLCFQYNSILQHDNSIIEHSDADSSLLHHRGGNVQFLQAKYQPNVISISSTTSAGLPANFRIPAEQPSRDEIARNRVAAAAYTAGRVLAEASPSFGPRVRLQFPNVDEYNNAGDAGGYESMGLPRVRLDNYVPPHRIVHFDLKGAPPKIAFLKQVMSLAKQTGATGILLEWEDMFPFSGQLASIKAGNAYTRDQIRDLLKAAKSEKLEVIPLVQTFGHLEFALKGSTFQHLREVPDSPQAICPSNNDSMPLIKQIITQVMEMTPDVKYLHIGCDEVFQMGECFKCRQVPRDNLFLSHVTRVAKFVRETFPNVQPIIWDDMLRHVPAQTIEEFRLGELVEPMVWVYAEDVYRFVPSLVWDKYAQIFPRIWAASAFKGAFGETMFVPNVKRHLENNLRWLEVMTAENPRLKGGFSGIALTGWQRYDHFAVLCELLPAAIPSLTVSMLAVSHGYFNTSLRQPMYLALGCQSELSSSHSMSFLNLNTDPFLWNKLSRCFFPGAPFYKLLYRLHSAEREVVDYLELTTRKRGWMTEYNIRRNYTAPIRVDELMTDHQRILQNGLGLVKHMQDTLSEIFDEFTVAEWIEQRMYPMLERLDRLSKEAEALKARKVWQPRPLPVFKELFRFGLRQPGPNH